MSMSLEVHERIGCNVGIPPENHILLPFIFRLRIHGMPRLHVVRPRLDMMVVPINSECTFEQRLLSILLYHYPRPTNIRPFCPYMML